MGSIVFILDKVLPKANFLKKFTLGRITAYKNEHTVELTYMAPNSNTASSLVRTIRTGQPGQASSIIIKTTTRDLRSLAILVDPSKESTWGKGVDIDLLMLDHDPAIIQTYPGKVDCDKKRKGPRNGPRDDSP